MNKCCLCNRYTYINMEKALLPNLWKILKSGGDGNAETIYPHFLPLISKLNRDIHGDKVLQFYGNFFEHFNTGLRLRLETKANGRSDILAISTAYFECLQYILIQIQCLPAEMFDANTDLNQFNLNLLQLHIIDVIKFLLTKALSQNGKYVLTRLVDLIQFWRQTSDENKIYADLLAHFWRDIYTTIEMSFSKEDSDHEIAAKLELVQELVHLLRTKSSSQMKTKSSKVTFNIVDDNATSDQIDGIVKLKQSSDKTYCFEAETFDLVVKLSKFYMKKTSDSVSDKYVQSLEAFFTQFADNKKFFEQLAGSETDIPKLYDKFASWLLLKDIRSERVLDITLMLYRHLEQIEKSKLLNKLIKFPNEMVKNWMLSRMLSHPLCTEPDVQRLLQQPIVTAQILKISQDLTHGNVNETINLMHKCFFQTETGDILIDSNTCQNIISILCKTLIDQNIDEHVLDACVSFLAQIMPVVCSDAQKNETRDVMFVQLFGLCVNRERLSMLSEDTLWEAVTSWQDALSSNDIQLNDQLLENCANVVKQSLEAIVSDQESTVTNIESLSEIVSKLILCSIERFEDDNDQKYQFADKIIENIFNKIDKQYDTLKTECLRACTFIELVNGNMTAVPSIMKYLDNDLCTLDAYKYANSLLKLATFKFRVIFKITCNVPNNRKPSNDTDSNIADVDTHLDEEHTEDYCDLNETLLKQWSQAIYTEIYNAIYLGGLFNSFLENFNVSVRPVCCQAEI